MSHSSTIPNLTFKETLAERYGGYIIAFCLHLMFFALLAMKESIPLRQAEPPQPKPIPVRLAAPLPPLEPAAEEPPPPTIEEPEMAEAAEAAEAVEEPLEVAAVEMPEPPEQATEPPAGSLQAAEVAEVAESPPSAIEEPAPAEFQFEADEANEPAFEAAEQMILEPLETVEKPLPEPQFKLAAEGPRTLIEAQSEGWPNLPPAPEESMRERETLLGGIAVPEEPVAETSRAVAKRMEMARAKVVANDTLFSSQGLDKGVLREIDISDVAPKVAEKVLDRYGIRIVIVQMNDAHPARITFLNSARTPQGHFMRRRGRGLYQAFQYGFPAVSRMLQLEEQELIDREYDPRRSRVVRVVFGVVPTTEGYDLGIKHFEAEHVSGIDEPAGSSSD